MSCLKAALVRGGLALIVAASVGLGAAPAPAWADPAPSAGGSCGPAPGQYGLTGVGADQFGPPGTTVPASYYKIDYNVVSPTWIGVIVRRDDDLGSGGVLTAFLTQGTGGSYEGVWRADIRPENQGWQNSVGPSTGRFDGPATSQRTRGGPGQSFYTAGGHNPGGYHFYLYTGEFRFGPDNVNRWVADETAYLGKFVCNVADNDAKN